MSWEKHQLHVTESLKRLEEQNAEILTKVNSFQTELAVHKVRTGFWGFLAGAVGGLLHFVFGSMK